ncbi:MAG TPA: zf-HC2 domain-containing protein [Terriglobales bacterium]|nr:zf-HC2 domain-containing protein [Terriglobales bacterium]
MTCLNDGILRAHLDRELSSSEMEEVERHLEGCADCRALSGKLQAENASAQNLLSALASSGDEKGTDPATAYAQFRTQFMTRKSKTLRERLFAPRWRPVWGLATVAILVAVLVGVGPARLWAQKVLAMLRVQKIAVVSIDPSILTRNNEADPQSYKLINQFFSDNVIVTMKAGKPDRFSSVNEAAQKAGYPIRMISDLGAPQNVLVSGETAFQMTVNRDRLETLLSEIGRSDIQIPESADGALIAVHIPKVSVSAYGDCPANEEAGTRNAQPQTPHAHKAYPNCILLVQAPSPTISVPPNLNMAEIAEAALELAGMGPSEARSFCQTVDWTSTLVVPIPRNSSSYEPVTVDGVAGTLITETSERGNRYSLLWVKDGMIHSLMGQGSSSDAMNLAASLQ